MTVLLSTTSRPDDPNPGPEQPTSLVLSAPRVTMASPVAPAGRAAGDVDVVHALLLVQGAFELVAALGMMLLMGGNPAYLLVPVLHSLALFVLAGLIVRGRRWPLITAIVLQSMALTGWMLNVVLGAIPQVDFTVNLVGLLTSVVLPGAVIVLSAGELSRGRAGRRAGLRAGGK